MAVDSGQKLTAAQQQIAERGAAGTAFVEGVAGTGKTTAAIERLSRMLSSRISAQEILIVVPQPLLGRPYRMFEARRRQHPGVKLRVTTYGSIVRRAVELFWPVVAEHIGHQIVRSAAVFLNTESAQIQLGRVIDPLLDDQRVFAGEHSVRLPRRRIYTQILDDLNKSALVGFPFEEIGQRLQDAWSGSDLQARMFADVQTCATAFRKHCLELGMLDFSLTVETFRKHVWPLDSCRTWLMQTARHLICDNVEEDTPAAHDLLIDLAEASESALFLFDQDANYRRFLGADEISARRLRAISEHSIELDELATAGVQHENLIAEFGITFGRVTSGHDSNEDPLRDVDIHGVRYFPEMMDSVCSEIVRLTEDEGVGPEQIAVVTPYLSDALRFAIVNRLEKRGVPAQSLRPSRPLGGEPGARCMLVLAQLAHPVWGSALHINDIASALSTSIDGLDPIRAFLLASTYRPRSGLPAYANLSESLKSRVTDELGRRYEMFRLWLAEYGVGQTLALDHFLSRLYGEVLVQPGFRYHESIESGNVAAALVRSTRENRRLAEELGESLDASAFVQRVLDGLIGEQALSRPDEVLDSVGVQVAPAYTFLMSNRQVSYQFWLDLGSSGWSERLQQPLGQPFVLNRNWPPGKRWTADDEALENAEFAYRLVGGLLRRCTGRVWLSHVDFNEQGFTQQGPLLVALQRILRRQNVIGSSGK